MKRWICFLVLLGLVAAALGASKFDPILGKLREDDAAGMAAGDTNALWGNITGTLTDQTDLNTELTNRYTKAESDSADTTVSNGVTTAFGTADSTLSNQILTAYTSADTTVSNGVTTAFGNADSTLSNQVLTAYTLADTTVSNGVTTAFGSADTIVSNGLSTRIIAESNRLDVIEARTNDWDTAVGQAATALQEGSNITALVNDAGFITSFTNTETFVWTFNGGVSASTEIDGYRLLSTTGSIQRIWMSLGD